MDWDRVYPVGNSQQQKQEANDYIVSMGGGQRAMTADPQWASPLFFLIPYGTLIHGWSNRQWDTIKVSLPYSIEPLWKLPIRETQSCMSLVIPNAARLTIKINSHMADILGGSFIDHRGMKLSTLCWGSFATMCRKYLVLIHSAPRQEEGQWGCCWWLLTSSAFCLPEDLYSAVCLSTHNPLS